MKNLVYITIALLAVACSKENRCFDGPGKESSRIIVLKNDFQKIHVFDNLGLHFINDSLNYLEIIGGNNLLPNITIDQSADILKIKNENKCQFMSKQDDITIIYHFTSLSELGAFGYGRISSDHEIMTSFRIVGDESYSFINLSINNDSIYISMNGAPQIDLSGTTNYLYAYSVGKANYHFEGLNAQHAHGHNKGIGDFHLKATQKYLIELRSIGDFYLYDTSGVEQLIYIEGNGKIYYRN